MGIISSLTSEELKQTPASALSSEESSTEIRRKGPSEGVRSVTEEEQEQVGKRKLSLSDELSIQARRAEENESVEDQAFAAKSYNSTLAMHPDSYQYPYSHSFTGDEVELYNGSVWFVHPWDRYKVMNWLSTDLIYIRPNTAWFSSYKYVLENQVTGDIADVNLIAPPYLETLWVLNVDINKGVAVLNDGTIWPLNSWDYSVYKKWLVGDRVVVGVNSPGRIGVYPYILINVEINNYCESERAY